METIRSEKLYAKFSKYEFWIRKVKFLRHTISDVGILEDPSKDQNRWEFVSTDDTDMNSPNSRSRWPTVVVHLELLANYGTSYDFDPEGSDPWLGKEEKGEKPLELQVRNQIPLEVSLWVGLIRFVKCEKLYSRELGLPRFLPESALYLTN